eukprot:755086-Hanusia_phi.AAC.9
MIRSAYRDGLRSKCPAAVRSDDLLRRRWPGPRAAPRAPGCSTSLEGTWDRIPPGAARGPALAACTTVRYRVA